MIELTYLRLLDASVAVSIEANERDDLRGLVLFWARPLERSAKNLGHTEDEVSSDPSSPEGHTADLATLDNGVAAGAVRGVLVSTHFALSVPML